MKKLILAAFITLPMLAAAQVTTDSKNSDLIERMNQVCLKISDGSYRSECIVSVSRATYFQEEAVVVVEKAQRVSGNSDNYYVSSLIATVRDKTYSGIILRAVGKCYDLGFDSAKGCMEQVNELSNNLSRLSPGGKTFRLPDETSMIIPTEVVILANETSGIVSAAAASGSNVRCDVHLLKDSISGSDVKYPQKILKLNGANITLNTNSVNIQILNDNHYGSITCSGAQLPDVRQREKLSAYFKAGGVDLKIPPPRDAQ